MLRLEILIKREKLEFGEEKFWMLPIWIPNFSCYSVDSLENLKWNVLFCGLITQGHSKTSLLIKMTFSARVWTARLRPYECLLKNRSPATTYVRLSKMEPNLSKNIVSLFNQTFHLYFPVANNKWTVNKTQLFQKKTKERIKLVAPWLSGTEWEAVILEWGFGGEKNIIHLCLSTPVRCPLSQPYSPNTHTHMHTQLFPSSVQVPLKKEEKSKWNN